MTSEPNSRQQRLVLIIAILASFVTFLDGSIINVALPKISSDLGGGLVLQQWVVDSYLITLGALMLLAGSLSDLYGRQKILVIGMIVFGLTSLLCAVAPTGEVLIISRGLQGAAGALLVPSSLALIVSTFRGPAQAKAIGTWTAWTGIAFIIGPLLGGLLVDLGSWRLIFAINILPIALTLYLITRLPAAVPREGKARLDIIGAALGAIGLGAPVFALIEHVRFGWDSPVIQIPLVVGLICAGLFIWHEKRAADPMLPLGLFKNRNFSAGNIATIANYGALTIGTFMITVFIQQVGTFSALQAGLALMPITLIMFVLSARFGALAGKFGPRLFMTVGPVLAGLGFLLLLRVTLPINYWTELLPGIAVFGIGLSITVAPLTSAILGSIASSQAGIGSAVNNAISRIAGLVGIAIIGLVTGPILTLAGFHRTMVLVSSLLFLGGLISFIGIRNAEVKNS